MLYALVEGDRTRIKRLQKENELRTLKSRIVSEAKGGWETEQSDRDVFEQHLAKKRVSSISQPQIQDSEWFRLSLQEKLAWAKACQDPRIAVGQQSPLEKRILDLGGVHTTAARTLIIKKYQEEYESLCKEQALSLDYWLAKAESYYNKRIMGMMKEQQTSNEIQEKATQSIEKQRYICVRPLGHAERHIYQAGKAREFRTETLRQLLQPISETTLPKIVPEEHGMTNIQRRKQVNEREQIQIKDHQERMIRGRELAEQRLKERLLRVNQSQPPTQKNRKVKKERKEFEKVTAYPLFQPQHASRIQVNILMEKSQNREEKNTVIKPYRRKFLTIPPFMKSQIGKIND